jgi:two-component system response regulator
MLYEVKPIDILMVEDNKADVILTEELLSESKMLLNMNVVEDGVKAMAYLRKEAPYEDAFTPDLVLLDLNLPRKSGHEVLREVKEDPVLKHIPIIVLSTSQASTDVRSAYSNYAAAYISKPVNLDEFSKVVNAIENFWFSVVSLPKK